jgi:uncharacterized spore protein YtfJ
MDAATVLEQTRQIFDARQVIGVPYEKNGTTVLPVVSIRGGGGGGVDSTPGKAGGMGGGIGLNAHPVGAYIIKGERVSWLPAVDVNRIVLGAQVVAVVALVAVRSIVRSRTRRAREAAFRGR